MNVETIYSDMGPVRDWNNLVLGLQGEAADASTKRRRYRNCLILKTKGCYRQDLRIQLLYLGYTY